MFERGAAGVFVKFESGFKRYDGECGLWILRQEVGEEQRESLGRDPDNPDEGDQHVGEGRGFGDLQEPEEGGKEKEGSHQEGDDVVRVGEEPDIEQ